MPYVPKTGNINDGKFKTDPFNSQKAFYQDPALVPGASGETIYYNQTEYEASPLNRILKINASGNSWAKEGGNRPLEQQYKVNLLTDSVRVWNISPGTIPTSSRIYPAGALYKNLSKDERGMRVIEFKDKDGHSVLKRVELTSNAPDGHIGWLNTYYVYDDLGNLLSIIPPKAVDLIKSSWVVDANTAKELCFFYRYDGNNRLIVKKLPGADSAEMVYDVRDRMVFSRDGNLKSTTKWLVTFYDDLNRPTMTALYNTASTREALQTSMNTATANTQIISYTFPGIADMVVASYDGRAEYKATSSITFENGFDSGSSEMLAQIDNTINGGVTSITATNPLPNIAAADLTPLSYSFYDNYNFSGKQNAVTADFSKPQYTGSAYAEPITSTSTFIQGLQTGTKVRVLGTDQWLTTTTYYTDKGRLLQTIADNVSGGNDILTSTHDFSGKLLSTYLRQTNPRSGTTPQTTIMTQLLYDAAGRLKSIKKRLNDQTSLERTIVENSYDELGQLKTKRLGVTSTTAQLETLNYEYNIRGWLKSINKTFVNTAGSTSNWFGQDLSYDYGFSSNQYNGNISGNKWKSKSNGIQRAYGYNYDNVNRLIIADFSQQNTGNTNWTKDQMDFSVSNLVYDANGNIINMTQKGMIGASIGTIDQLSYTYQANSNKLLSVNDAITNTTTDQLQDFINGNTTGDDYAYDTNGNLTKDLNKSIGSITYNHLNLPELITFTGKGNIRYQYDANGNKLSKLVTDNTGPSVKSTTTNYLGSFVYQNDTLQMIGHEEGRIRTIFKNTDPVTFAYDYFLKDYLGDTRMVLTEQTDFGMYVATMEIEKAVTETALFSNMDETRAAKPAGYPQDQTVAENSFVSRLNAKAGGKKIGPSLVLKVMAGDTIQIRTNAFYKTTTPEKNKNATPEDMVVSLLNVFGGTTTSDVSHAARQAENLSPFRNFNSNDYQRMKERDPDGNREDKPKAYLNFVLFDEQFKLVENNSGVRQVKGEADELQTLAVDKMVMQKSGFIYVYTSNETAQDVYFDNITVQTISGPLLEETHYYPFGLTMEAISNNALKGLNYAENRLKYNGKELQNKEFADGSGLNWYDYGARMYDAQIGRWQVMDAMMDKIPSITPYNYCLNNPVRLLDPTGMWAETEGGMSTTDPEEIRRFLNGLKASSKRNIAEAITDAAEYAHKAYEDLSTFAKKNPGSVKAVNVALSALGGSVNQMTELNPDKMTWLDLTLVWLFELGSSEKIEFGGNALLTKDLMDEEGVNNARAEANKRLENGENSFTVNKVWAYGQDAFYSGIKEKFGLFLHPGLYVFEYFFP